MYQSIYVPVDNSAHSNRAIDAAVQVGKAFSAKVVGCHVYAAKMHEYRFKQMEYSLPEEYLEENELERQRKIHDSLITLGLKLISDSYLEGLKTLCEKEGLSFESRMIDGKHHTEIRRDLAASDCDLVVLGALGLGRQRDSQIGSVCERVTRACRQDAWIVKHVPEKDEPERDTILVGIDGSPKSFGALDTALALARQFGKKIELIGVYDPYLHYMVFNGLVGCLTENAAKVFRFEEQNQLHEEIIDTGLAKIYQSHLDVAEKMANAAGMEISKTLLDGKTFQKIHDHARKTKPWLLVMGRIGLHGEPGEEGLGSNAENLLRLADCDILLTTKEVRPELDIRAEESIRWTEQAEERMTRVPKMVVGIARTAILRLALEKGHSVITSSLLDEAMDRFMPKQGPMDRLAEAVAIGKAREHAVAVCRECGVTASEPDPAVCTVCGAKRFDVLTAEMVESLVQAEGGASEESSYDGRKLRWTEESKSALNGIKDAYLRRRTKARIEKSARLRKLGTVTLEFAQRLIEEETGLPFAGSPGAGKPNAEVQSLSDPDGKRLIARDAQNNPLFSTFEWTPDAAARVLRVPAGFMRNRTQDRIEDLAREQGVQKIELAHVEAGIEIGLKMMAEMIAQQKAGPAPARAEEPAAEAKCPAASEQVAAHESEPLNEVSAMTELKAMRMLLSDKPKKSEEETTH